jgi:hypothetical protein
MWKTMSLPLPESCVRIPRYDEEEKSEIYALLRSLVTRITYFAMVSGQSCLGVEAQLKGFLRREANEHEKEYSEAKAI